MMAITPEQRLIQLQEKYDRLESDYAVLSQYADDLEAQLRYAERHVKGNKN